MERRLAAILLTDMVGYSRLIRIDEEGTIARPLVCKVNAQPDRTTLWKRAHHIDLSQRGTHRRNAQAQLSASCRAVGFHPPRGKYRAVVSYLKSNFNGGVSTYRCRMSHVHIDSRPRARWSKCQ